jgi:hypothetical protein
MARILQLRKGTAAENNIFTGSLAELTYDTTNKGLRIHDGATQGGFHVPTVIETLKPTAGNNYTWYRKYSDGWVEQGGRYNNATDKKQGSVSITLPIEMANEFFSRNVTPINSSDTSTTANSQTASFAGGTWSSSGTKVLYINVLSTQTAVYWEVRGYAKQ